MGKKDSKSTVEITVLSPEEFQKLTPEQQLELLNTLAAKNAEAEAAVKKLEAKAKKQASKPGKKAEKVLPSFEVDADKKNGIEGGEYEFTAETFTHKGVVLNAAEVVKQAESDDEHLALTAQTVLADLVKRKSGVLKRKEA